MIEHDRSKSSTNDVEEQERCYSSLVVQALKAWSGSVEYGSDYQREVEALARVVEQLIAKRAIRLPVSHRCPWCGVQR